MADGMASTPGLLLLLMGYCLALIEGEIRCYCNESGCVSTGYMCKSTFGQCYTSMDIQGDVTRATQGCVDSLSEELRSMCGDGEELVKNTNEGSARVPSFLCCKEDMCNYIHTIDINVVPDTKSNGSAQKGQPQASPGNNHVVYSRNPEERDPERDLWFKAAVIAVPIAGGFILILLVLLAVRMLRTDSRRDRRNLFQVRRERGLVKTHLYVADHFSGGDQPEKSCSLFQDKHKAKHKHKPTCGALARADSATCGSNIKVDKQGRVYEKVCDKNFHRHSHPSFVSWGKSSNSDYATVV